MSTTIDKVSAQPVQLPGPIANGVITGYRSRRSSPRWLGLRRTKTPLSTWVRTLPNEYLDCGWIGLTFGEGQLKAKLAKLKRELLTPTGGGGGGAGGEFYVEVLRSSFEC